MGNRRYRIAALMGIVAALTLANSATAQTVGTIACLPGIPAAGYVDVDPASVHKRDIDCIAFWEITTQVGTYGPTEPVSRWQMALFLTRLLGWELPLPDGTPLGFVDIGGVSPEAQIAIYQLGDLAITSGTSPTTYAPEAPVTREQMALFLARTVFASGVTLPDGGLQGFADIGGLSSQSQTAINQVAQLGITTGTTPTTFSPAATVTREQMASFLARTFNVIWTLSFFDFSDQATCVIPPTGPIDCDSSGPYAAGYMFAIREGFFSTLEDPGTFDPSLGRFELLLDGALVTTVDKTINLPGITYRIWEAPFPGGLTGTHVLEGRWFESGQLTMTFTVNVQFA